MQDVLKHAAKRFAEIIITAGKDYLAATVAQGLLPVIKEGIMECLDETKKEVGMKVEEKPVDPLGGDMKGAEQPDLFNLELDKLRIVESGWSYQFTAYTIYCIRVGTDKKGKFFALGKKYELTYNILSQMHDRLKKEFPKEKVANLPPEAKHGNYCCCLTYRSDMVEAENTMRNYMRDVVKLYPTSKDIPSFFYLGDKWEQQQRNFKVFLTGFENTKKSVLKGEYYRVLEPFNEGEAINILLRSFARHEVIPEVRRHIPNIPGCTWRMYYNADSAILTAIDTAMAAGWPPAQLAVDKGKELVAEQIEKGAQKLVQELKPVLKKVLEIVQAKMSKKEEKEEPKKEDESKKKTQIGDTITKWRFHKTQIGGKFHSELNGADAKAALKNLHETFDPAMNQHIKEKVSQGTAALLGDRAANLEIVQAIIAKIAEQAVRVINKFTTLKPLMYGAEKMFDVRQTLENQIIQNKASGMETINKLIDDASGAMWKTFPDVGLHLFREMDHIKDQITADLSGDCPESGRIPLYEAADHLYNEQMKALNSLRTSFINQLKARIAGDASILMSDDAIKDAIRMIWRELTFEIIHVVMPDSWSKVANAIRLSAIEQVKHKFDEDIWPNIVPALEAVQAMIPEAIANLGLKVEPLAHTVATILLTKGVDWALTTLVIKLEFALFEQGQNI